MGAGQSARVAVMFGANIERAVEDVSPYKYDCSRRIAEGVCEHDPLSPALRELSPRASLGLAYKAGSRGGGANIERGVEDVSPYKKHSDATSCVQRATC